MVGIIGSETIFKIVAALVVSFTVIMALWTDTLTARSDIKLMEKEINSIKEEIDNLQKEIEVNLETKGSGLMNNTKRVFLGVGH